jgi:hypothetical protein
MVMALHRTTSDCKSTVLYSVLILLCEHRIPIENIRLEINTIMPERLQFIVSDTSIRGSSSRNDTTQAQIEEYAQRINVNGSKVTMLLGSDLKGFRFVFSLSRLTFPLRI